MSLSLILWAFSLLFLAEMGDKTQLAVMTLASRYAAWPVAAGAFTAFFVLNALAVLVGDALSRYLPESAVLLAAGLLFLFFAYRTARDAEDDDGDGPADSRSAFLASFSMVFVAELGDKTQLALIALAASTGDPWSVFVGGTLALWSVSLVGVFAGRVLLARLPRHWVHYGAAVLFAGCGVYALWEAFNALGAGASSP
jgi:putative Ca2+/H+ antiporter (TMEM165/GDT1 family)